jgi:hypothetical protein
MMIRKWWNTLRDAEKIAAAVLLGLCVAATAFALIGNPDVNGLLLNFGTEMGGALVTFVLLQEFVGGREKKMAEMEKKASLIRQMDNPNNGIVIQAVKELRAYGWLSDGSLQGADLFGANLQGTLLVKADLRDAALLSANLQDAYLQEANLEGAMFNMQTILPNGQTWTPDADLSCFTDETHPNFWQPDWVKVRTN